MVNNKLGPGCGSECVDVKEYTYGGLIANNVLIGTGACAAPRVRHVIGRGIPSSHPLPLSCLLLPRCLSPAASNPLPLTPACCRPSSAPCPPPPLAGTAASPVRTANSLVNVKGNNYTVKGNWGYNPMQNVISVHAVRNGWGESGCRRLGPLGNGGCSCWGVGVGCGDSRRGKRAGS